MMLASYLCIRKGNDQVIERKILVIAAVIAGVLYLSSPIMLYKYKVYSCATDQVNHYRGSWSIEQAKAVCHRWINGAPAN